MKKIITIVLAAFAMLFTGCDPKLPSAD